MWLLLKINELRQNKWSRKIIVKLEKYVFKAKFEKIGRLKFGKLNVPIIKWVRINRTSCENNLRLRIVWRNGNYIEGRLKFGITEWTKDESWINNIENNSSQTRFVTTWN